MRILVAAIFFLGKSCLITPCYYISWICELSLSLIVNFHTYSLVKLNCKSLTRWCYYIYNKLRTGCVSAMFPDLVPSIGIDLGTTYSRVGVYISGRSRVKILGITPSWVAFTDTEILVGQAAKDQAALNQERTVFHFKQLMGRKYVINLSFFFIPYVS